jgi:hypothetical protein
VDATATGWIISLAGGASQPVEVLVDLEPGLHQVTFRSITLARDHVFDPGTF